jgi:hypothetical protein
VCADQGENFADRPAARGTRNSSIPTTHPSSAVDCICVGTWRSWCDGRPRSPCSPDSLNRAGSTRLTVDNVVVVTRAPVSGSPDASPPTTTPVRAVRRPKWSGWAPCRPSHFAASARKTQRDRAESPSHVVAVVRVRSFDAARHDPTVFEDPARPVAVREPRRASTRRVKRPLTPTLTGPSAALADDRREASLALHPPQRTTPRLAGSALPKRVAPSFGGRPTPARRRDVAGAAHPRSVVSPPRQYLPRSRGPQRPAGDDEVVTGWRCSPQYHHPLNTPTRQPSMPHGLDARPRQGCQPPERALPECAPGNADATRGQRAVAGATRTTATRLRPA